MHVNGFHSFFLHLKQLIEGLGRKRRNGLRVTMEIMEGSATGQTEHGEWPCVVVVVVGLCQISG